MNISQDAFNKIITILLFLFFMAVYIFSLVSGKTVNWEMLLTFLVPTINHIAHQYTTTAIATKSIDSSTSKEVAQIQANGFHIPT